jgi:hypothetical protein
MVKLNPAPLVEGRTVAEGRILNVVMKTIEPKNGDNPFRIAEFEVGNLVGPIRDVMGNGTLRVGLACDRVSLRSQLGRLAHGCFGWDGKTQLDTDDFLNRGVEFIVEPIEKKNGMFFEVDRKTFGPIGHLSTPDQGIEDSHEPVEEENLED